MVNNKANGGGMAAKSSLRKPGSKNDSFIGSNTGMLFDPNNESQSYQTNNGSQIKTALMVYQ